MAVSHSVEAGIFFAGLSHALLQFGSARTFLARAIAAEGMKAPVEQAIAEERENAATHARSQDFRRTGAGTPIKALRKPGQVMPGRLRH